MKKYVANEGYRNQKYITIKNKAVCDNKENFYMRIQIQALTNAMKNLSSTGLQLFLYFSKNQAGYSFWLSKADVLDNTGIKSEATYLKAVKELIDKGYLIQENEGSNKYLFYEVPSNDIDAHIEEQKEDTGGTENNAYAEESNVIEKENDIKENPVIKEDTVNAEKKYKPTKEDEIFIKDKISLINDDLYSVEEVIEDCKQCKYSKERTEYILLEVQSRLKKSETKIELVENTNVEPEDTEQEDDSNRSQDMELLIDSVISDLADKQYTFDNTPNKKENGDESTTKS